MPRICLSCSAGHGQGSFWLLLEFPLIIHSRLLIHRLRSRQTFCVITFGSKFLALKIRRLYDLLLSDSVVLVIRGGLKLVLLVTLCVKLQLFRASDDPSRCNTSSFVKAKRQSKLKYRTKYGKENKQNGGLSISCAGFVSGCSLGLHALRYLQRSASGKSRPCWAFLGHGGIATRGISDVHQQ